MNELNYLLQRSIDSSPNNFSNRTRLFIKILRTRDPAHGFSNVEEKLLLLLKSAGYAITTIPSLSETFMALFI